MKLDKNSRRKIGKRAYPLKKIIERNVEGEVFGIGLCERTHLLECGHSVLPPSDIYGERTPSSMRCRQCYELNNNKN